MSTETRALRVGDLVQPKNPGHGVGGIIRAIHKGDAWIESELGGHITTVLRNLRLVPEACPATWPPSSYGPSDFRPPLYVSSQEIEMAQYEIKTIHIPPVILGDVVVTPRHGIGKVLAVTDDHVWVRTEKGKYPLTFEHKDLRLFKKPRTTRANFPDGEANGWPCVITANAVELTPEVRERLKGLL